MIGVAATTAPVGAAVVVVVGAAVVVGASVVVVAAVVVVVACDVVVVSSDPAAAVVSVESDEHAAAIMARTHSIKVMRFTGPPVLGTSNLANERRRCGGRRPPSPPCRDRDLSAGHLPTTVFVAGMGS